MVFILNIKKGLFVVLTVLEFTMQVWLSANVLTTNLTITQITKFLMEKDSCVIRFVTRM